MAQNATYERQPLSGLTKLLYVTSSEADMRIWVQLFGGPAPCTRTWESQNIHAKFRTTAELESEYPQNELRDRQEENGVINYYPWTTKIW